MAENVQITQGSGTTIAADDIGGVLHQRVKLSQGADGVGVDVSAAAPLQVSIANTGTNATPVVVDLGANNDVTVTGSVAVTGTFYQATQPVSVASVPSHDVTNAGTFSVQNTAATPAGTNNIGDVDVLTINGVAPAFGTGARGATVQRVTIATDDSVPVTGTFYQATQPVSMATNTPLGTVAHDSADSGAPIKTGGRAVSAEITPVTTGDRTDSIHDLAGRQIIMPYANPENQLAGLITTAMTGTTSTAVTGMGAQGGSLRNYITTVIISNSHATVGTDVVLQDGNGGSTLGTFPAAAVYGGVAINLPVPIKTTANTALYAANITTGASTKVSCYGYKGY